VLVSTSGGTSAKGDAQESLLTAAKLRFANDLTLAEEGLMRAARIGQGISVTNLSNHTDPVTGADWPKERTIRADRLLWLCTDPVASASVSYRGIHVIGARIEGTLDFTLAKVPFAFSLEKCSVNGDLLLQQSELRVLRLDGTHLDNLWADEARIGGTLFLRKGFKARGEVRLLGATVAFDAQGAQIAGSMFFRSGFTAEGEMRLRGATVHGTLEFDGGLVSNTMSNGVAIGADGLTVKSSVFLRDGFKARGGIRLFGGTIGRDLDLSSA